MQRNFKSRSRSSPKKNRKSTKNIGFAIGSHAPDLGFCFLDYIATHKDIISAGVGGALYERVREEGKNLNATGLFFECLPDEPTICSNSELIAENKKRLRFYEAFGARPIINTKYEAPLSPTDSCPPHLVYDDLDSESQLMGVELKKIVQAILERKYATLCPASYRSMPGTEELLKKELTTAYVGIDPTADSLHIGHLVGVMMLKHLQANGHRPIVLLGGATGMIGDPSGKSQERNLLDEEALRNNQEALKKQLSRFLDFDSKKPNSAIMVNNYDWMKDFSFLQFIRDVGKHITVNYML